MALHTITKSPAVRVRPALATPTGTLALSSMDRCNPSRITIDCVLVFTHGEKAAALIRDAFAKAFVHYYPVAGKIIEIILVYILFFFNFVQYM
jgi:Transferase family